MPDARGVLTAQPGEGRAAPRVDYPIFDLIRGICALVVVARHSAPLWDTKAQRGYLAVDAFFILSGFVIAHAYEAKLVARAMGFAQFARIRLIRLYPMYLVGLVVGLLCEVLRSRFGAPGRPIGVVQLFIAGALTAAFLPVRFPGLATLFPLNVPFWSLHAELVSNLAYSAVAPRLTRRLLVAGIAAMLAGIVGLAYHEGTFDLGYRWTLSSYTGGVLRSSYGFTMGVLLYRASNSGSRPLPSLSWWVSPLVMMGAFLIPTVGRLDWLVDVLIATQLFPAMVLLASASRASGHLARACTILGRLSYPLYAIHMPLAELAYRLGGPKAIAMAPWTGMAWSVSVVALAMALERWFDAPVRRWLTDRFRSGRVAAPAAR